MEQQLNCSRRSVEPMWNNNLNKSIPDIQGAILLLQKMQSDVTEQKLTQLERSNWHVHIVKQKKKCSDPCG